jgi:tRNA-splicing ligase RtcB/release factor H-coupled RctB family protein
MYFIEYYCDPASIEQNALDQLKKYAQKPFLEKICAFTDIHFCDEKAIPVGVAFTTTDYFYPLITGKDIGCGVMYLKIAKAFWLKPFDKKEHYQALNFAQNKMTDDGLGGGNHFLSIEEDDEAVYIICHTGTRDRGIGLYQHCIQLTRDFSLEYGSDVDFIHRDFAKEDFFQYYQSILQFGYERRKNFCIKTLTFLQNANYVQCNKSGINKAYLQHNVKKIEDESVLHGTPYILVDSVHNHLRFEDKNIIHRKGSTELADGRPAVIPLSMSRGSLIVKGSSPALVANALWSCAHGAGRKLSRFNAIKHWKTVLKEKERRLYKEQFAELLDKSNNFPAGYIQEFDFAYKDATEIFQWHPHLKKITQTKPVATFKYTEI